MKFAADRFAPLQKLKDFDLSGQTTLLLSPSNVRKYEVGTFLSFLQNLLFRTHNWSKNYAQIAQIMIEQNDIFVNKITEDITKGLGINSNLMPSQRLDWINEFVYDPINTPVYNPSQNENFDIGRVSSEIFCLINQLAYIDFIRVSVCWKECLIWKQLPSQLWWSQPHTQPGISTRQVFCDELRAKCEWCTREVRPPQRSTPLHKEHHWHPW